MRSDRLLMPADLLPWPAYLKVRSAERRRMAEHRRRRAVALGPSMRLVFEDRFTLAHHVQEVACVDRLDEPAALSHEIDAMKPLWPDGLGWKATLQIELPDADQRRRELPRLSAAVHRLQLRVCGHRPLAVEANEDLPDRHLGRPSAVHFLRLELPAAARADVMAGAPVALRCTDERYDFCAPMPADLLAQLRTELDLPARAGTDSALV